MSDPVTNKQLQTPVLLIIFNRPRTTEEVFEAIQKARPVQLFIAADGPRDHIYGDREKCAEARSVVERVNWNCDVKILFQNRNLGCGIGPATGITWFFKHVDEGIILEDDCLPSPAFFPYCAELLSRYRFDKRIMEIGGVNLIADVCHKDRDSYFFSQHNHTWGWATWKRAWDLYDYTIAKYGEIIVKESLGQCFNSKLEYAFFKRYFDETFQKHCQINWWDYQWEFARRINLGLSIVSKVNLISNLGVGPDATHTLNPLGTGHDLKWGNLLFPLQHPENIAVNKSRDHYYFCKTFTTFRSRMKFRIKNLIGHVNREVAEMIQ